MPQFAYTPHPQSPVGMPLVDLKLSNGPKGLIVSSLIDSGAALNILPFDVGLELGFIWEEQIFSIDLGGVLEGVQGFGIIVEAEVESLKPVSLAFAWVNRPSSQIRTLLGQVNFFQEFDVHFYGSKQVFEVETKLG